MVCVYCGGDTEVTNSRKQKRNNQVWRRRQCLKCKAIFTSHEAIDYSSALWVGPQSSPRPFSEDLLYTDILLALQDRRDCYTAAREVTATVIRDLLKLPQKPFIKASQISRVAGGVLSRLDKRAYLRYAAEHPSLQ